MTEGIPRKTPQIDWERIDNSLEPLSSVEPDRGIGTLVHSQFDDLPVGFARPSWVPLSTDERHVIDIAAYERDRDQEQSFADTEPKVRKFGGLVLYHVAE